MKPFFKNPKTQRWFLVSGLLLALGFNLSWNPENTHIVRYEYAPNVTEFASTTEIDMDSPLCTMKAHYSKFKDEDGKVKVQYSLEGDVCLDCLSKDTPNGFKNLVLSGTSLDSIDDIEGIIKQDAVKYCKPSGKDKKDGGKTAAKDDENEMDAACKDLDVGDDMTGCEEALKEHADSCDGVESAGEKRTCLKSVKNAFDKYLRIPLMKALAMPMDSDEYQAAIEARDALIVDMPPAFDKSIRSDLVQLTLIGVGARAQQTFSTCLSVNSITAQCPMGGGNPQYAFNSAKQLLRLDTNNTGATLYSALGGYVEIEPDKTMAMRSLFQNNFSTPLRNLYVSQLTGNGFDLSPLGAVTNPGGDIISNSPDTNLLQLNLNGSTEASPDSRGNLRSVLAPEIPQAFTNGTAGNALSPLMFQNATPAANRGGRGLLN